MSATLTKSYRFGNFVLDARSVSLRRGDVSVPLRPKSFDVLHYLVCNQGRLITKDELFGNVWSDVIVTDNSLVQCIKEVRQALGDEQQTMVETIAKRGYMFSPAVFEIVSSVPAAETPAAGVGAVGPGRGRSVAAVSVVVVLMLTLGAWVVSGLRSTPQQSAEAPVTGRAADSRLSIAVLPFGVLGEDTNDYFSIGISEDIAAALGRFPDLAVTSPKAATKFVDSAEHGNDTEHRVQYLVEGSVRRTAERVRIAVRLIGRPHGTILWSESYDASAATIFVIEDDIVIRVAGALAVKLTNLRQIRLASTSVGSLEAYDLVLRGRHLHARLSRTTHSQARAIFERAIALDLQYAPAYVGLGRIDLSAVALGWTQDPEASLRRAEELARKAISLDEFNPAAHVLLGRAYARLADYERAVEALRRAVTLNPSDPDSHAGLGDALLWSGEVEGAIKELEIATSVDPRLSAEDLFSLGAAYFLSGRTADATRIFERVTVRKEGNPFTYAMLAAVYAETGRDSDSRWAAGEVRKLNPFFDVARFGSLFKKAEHRELLATALKRTGL
jgi:TolB-like protein/DNA-binding winged helix-turn-helix (wHTH) protein/cytochrome c-type biogenesis protein CcmH/NrfG